PRFPLPVVRAAYCTLVPNCAWLSAGSASGVGDAADPWTVIKPPAGVGRALTVTAKSALAPAASAVALQAKLAERGPPLVCLLQCQPAGGVTDAVAVMVLPSISSVGCAASTPPLLVRVNTYSARNAVRGSVAGPSIDSDRSACAGRSTSSDAVAPSLDDTGSGVCDCTAAARPSVVPAMAASGVTVTGKDWVAPAASESIVQVMVPTLPPPSPSALQAQPPGVPTSAWTAWSNTIAIAANAAASGPALPASTVKVAASPGRTLPGDTLAATCRSADWVALSRSSSRVGSWSDRRVGESVALRAIAGKSALMRAWLTESVSTSAASISAALARMWSSDWMLPS